MNREEVESRVRGIMVELFELDPEAIVLEARVFEDLDLDSIDAIDLVARLQQLTGSRVPEDAVKAVRTVEDIVNLACSELAKRADADADPPQHPTARS